MNWVRGLSLVVNVEEEGCVSLLCSCNRSWRKLCYEPHQSTNHSSDEEGLISPRESNVMVNWLVLLPV
ncbi:hypothetical protein Pmani_027653 [Petrolisthes manimaculis]|uniref:Uncharacterized protein n=1 Tax=Petrolisthes manimaculis TaxID=1843537 RepID=A0AAE1TWA8_9EUCA|nr:hypothetical protein Pmani_027653 [Petrolisthes manimaculis]